MADELGDEPAAGGRVVAPSTAQLWRETSDEPRRPASRAAACADTLFRLWRRSEHGVEA